MRTLDIIMPMGGAGSRFAAAGYTTPKPLLPVDGVPMFLKAASSLEQLRCKKRYVVVIRNEHVRQYGLDRRIREYLPEATVVTIEKMTRGSVETCLAAESAVDPGHGLAVLDCDLWFRSERYVAILEQCLAGSRPDAGALLWFHSDRPRYSYAAIEGERVLRTAEKEPISCHALVGSYFFSAAEAFFKAGWELLAQPIGTQMPEYYVSLLYNLLLKQGATIAAAPVEEYYSFGTPDELEAYRSRR